MMWYYLIEMPLLQLAIDLVDPERAIDIARKVEGYFEIIEVGTPLIKSSGINIIKRLREAFPSKVLFADLKIMDAGRIEAEMAYNAGADMVSVCGQAPFETIKETIEEARRQGKRAMIDLIGAKDMISRALELKEVKPDYFCIHTGLDEQRKGKRPSEFLQEYRQKVNYPYAIAGGIRPEDIPLLMGFSPEIIIVGGYVTKALDPVIAAKTLKDAVRRA